MIIKGEGWIFEQKNKYWFPFIGVSVMFQNGDAYVTDALESNDHSSRSITFGSLGPFINCSHGSLMLKQIVFATGAKMKLISPEKVVGHFQTNKPSMEKPPFWVSQLVTSRN